MADQFQNKGVMDRELSSNELGHSNPREGMGWFFQSPYCHQLFVTLPDNPAINALVAERRNESSSFLRFPMVETFTMEEKTMRIFSRLRPVSIMGLVLLAIMLLALPASVSAGTVTWTSPDGTVTISFHFPDSYSSCSPSDTIYTTGLPATWKVMGQYSFWDLSVVPAVRLSPYVNQTFIGTDLQQVIVYPPTSSWPLIDPVTGTRAIWVLPIAVIFDETGTMVAQLQGTGPKYMVTCTPPPQVQACTPGYWRNHPESWVGYSPEADFDATFGVDYFNPDITLMQAAWLGGGGVNKVARFGVAALLSATHPGIDFALSPDEVFALVLAGDGDALGNLFPTDAVCPID